MGIDNKELEDRTHRISTNVMNLISIERQIVIYEMQGKLCRLKSDIFKNGYAIEVMDLLNEIELSYSEFVRTLKLI